MKTKLLILLLLCSTIAMSQNTILVIGNQYNPDCKKIIESLELVKQIYDFEWVMVTYYQGDPNQTEDSQDWARSMGLSPYPSFIVNGHRYGLLACEDTLAYIEERISENLVVNKLNIQFVNQRKFYHDNDFYDLRIYFRGNTPRNIKLYVLLVENNILKEIHPDYTGIPADLKTNKTEIVYYTFQCDKEDMRLVTFVQDTDNGQVIASKAENIKDIHILGVNNLLISEPKFFPNPVEEIVNLQGEFKEATITDQLGRMIYKGNETQVDLSDLTSGLYLLRFDNGPVEKLLKK